ncbi:YgjV family protein [Ferrimonas lipolytica]|uniref:YgjV family protein n=2 Tax=Ferrimonas lipolytica TaxID=2724191 RepID=A0A6H1UID0_9GAMM|nr:YgjV family protein [Ferrimonas lipolytica]
MAMGWWANSQHCDKRLVQGNTIAAALTAVHFGLMGSPLAMSNQLVNVARFSLCQRYRHASIALLFAALAVIQGLLLANHWSEWMVVTAAVVSSFLLFFTHGFRLRLGLLLCAGLNITLSIHLLSWSGIIYQLVSGGMLIRSLVTPPPQPAIP